MPIWNPPPAGSATTPDPIQQSYAPGSYTVLTGKFTIFIANQTFTGAQTMTLKGTARARGMN